MDMVKTIESYPNVGMLSTITDVKLSVGGCVPNTGINLAKIDSTVSLEAIGQIGNDENGRYAVAQMEKYGMRTDKISVTADAPTSFSDVMSQPSGERTFFHSRGANATFSPANIDISKINSSILHIGYILLLDSFDQPDSEYGTVMARFLHDVREAGIKTSIDVVSSNDADYNRTISPALKYCNYFIVNEIECCGIWGLDPYNENGEIQTDRIRLAMEKCVEHGVAEKVVVHSKKVSFCLDAKSGNFTAVPSLKIPRELIKGSVGAGDAFCAACLYGLYNAFDDKFLLEFASAAAACNLFAENSVDGMMEKSEILKMAEKYERLPL
ncbi:MAG: carbohydrate kinase family protein [Clostridia bacterium]|nr:carbohydrate kinase family protein [Clostridia bacterium]MBQ7289064.1 carbohydrate kinase family protein [Clostridia bacterium]